EPLRPAHFERVLTASLEIVERFSPILGFRHAYVLPHGGFVARPVLWWRPAAPGYAALAIATSYGGGPLRPATPRWRSPRPMVAARCARLRRAGDRHAFVGSHTGS